MTGDIAWYGNKKDFDEALSWFRRLLEVTGLSGNEITFCPGNHDVNRRYGWNQIGLNSGDGFKKIDEIDDFYQYDRVHLLEWPLYNYEKFCEELKVVPYHYPRGDKWEASYAIGYKDVKSKMNDEKLRLVSFNTALLSFLEHYPDDKMFIGLEQVKKLLEIGIIGLNRDCYTVALFHHAERFLHPQEISEYNQRYATLPLLRRYVDLVLCGHTETGGIPVLNKQRDGAEMLTGGAAYYSDDHENSYSVIHLPDHKFKEKEVSLYPYVFSADNGWHENHRLEYPQGEKSKSKKWSQFDKWDDFKLSFKSGDREKSLMIKCLSGDYDTTHGVLENTEEVCRNITFSCKAQTDKPGDASLHFSISPRKEKSVEANLEMEELFKFLHHATHDQNRSVFKLIEISSGREFLTGDGGNFEGKFDEDIIAFLTKVREIEKRCNIRFQCPEGIKEDEKVNILIDLITTGFTQTLDAPSQIKREEDDKRRLKKVGLATEQNQLFFFLYSGPFKCRLFGNEFLLGNFSVLMGPYTAKGSRTLEKSLTFEEGDKRELIFNLCDESARCYVFDENKVDSQSFLNGEEKVIAIDKINLIWNNFIWSSS